MHWVCACCDRFIILKEMNLKLEICRPVYKCIDTLNMYGYSNHQTPFFFSFHACVLTNTDCVEVKTKG